MNNPVNTHQVKGSEETHGICTAFQALTEEESTALLKTMIVDKTGLMATALIDTGATCPILNLNFEEN